MNGQFNVQQDKQINGQMDSLMSNKITGQWMNGQFNVLLDKQINGRMDSLMSG